MTKTLIFKPAIVYWIYPLQTLLFILGTEFDRILSVFRVAYRKTKLFVSFSYLNKRLNRIGIMCKYQFDFALLCVLGVWHDSIAITALQNNEAKRFRAIYIFIVEEKVLMQREPFYLPFASWIVRTFP